MHRVYGVNMSLEQQFIYPRNKNIRNAYIAFLVEMYKHETIRFSFDASIDIIIKSQNKYDDSKQAKYGRALGKNGLDAQKMLRSLSPFVIPVTIGVFELCVYNQTKERIINFADFFSLCALDIHMSRQEPNHDELVYTPWDGAVSHGSADPHLNSSIQEDIDRVNSATVVIDDNVQQNSMSSLNSNRFEKDGIIALLHSTGSKG